MSAFGVNTGSQATLPLINGVIHSALFQSTPHGDKMLSQLDDVMDSDLIHILLCDWPDGIVNRVEIRWVRGAVLLESEHVSRNTSYCRQKFLQQKISVILSINLCSGSTNISSLSASKFWYSNRHHQWLAKGCACAQQSSRWDILLSQGTVHVKTVILHIWWWNRQ